MRIVKKIYEEKPEDENLEKMKEGITMCTASVMENNPAMKPHTAVAVAYHAGGFNENIEINEMEMRYLQFVINMMEKNRQMNQELGENDESMRDKEVVRQAIDLRNQLIWDVIEASEKGEEIIPELDAIRKARNETDWDFVIDMAMRIAEKTIW